MSDAIDRRKGRADEVLAYMGAKRYAYGELILLVQKVTFLRERTAQELIKDMVRVGWLKIDEKGYYRKV